MKVLLHTCCAPCAIYPVSRLKEEGNEITGFWYNPNIHPYREYCLRLEAVKTYAQDENIQVIYKDDYDLKGFLRTVLYREGERCRFCYFMRLVETAKAAKHGRFDSFTTTLLVSSHQKHELVREIGEQVARDYQVRFYYEDFRPGVKAGMALAKERGFYRQQYCGCIFSEYARYHRVGDK